MIESKQKVTKLEDLLAASAKSKENKDDTNIKTNNENKTDKKDKLVNKEQQKHVVPRGKPKSGRVWKEQKQRFKSIVKTKGLQVSLDKKKKLREELKRAKELSREIKAQKEAEKEAKKERRRENLKRTEENKKKHEVVQVIKNTSKIKRMKKKQLRNIEKRDTVNV